MFLPRVMFLLCVLTAPVWGEAIDNESRSQESPSNSLLLQFTTYPLSEEAQEILQNRIKKALKTTHITTFQLSEHAKQIALGMNQVPVLNQGSYGTCVTFAITAAFDAIFKRGDYISQLCSLTLGAYLEQNGYQHSGWYGASFHEVYSQIQTFGIINQSIQKKKGCGGLKNYPVYSHAKEFTQKQMSTETYNQLSESIITRVAWFPLLDAHQAIIEKADMNGVLEKVKSALNHKNRLIMGFLIPCIDNGIGGAVGWHHFLEDSWVITKDTAKDIAKKTTLPQHAIIITGYDDNAIVMDFYGRRTKGLLILRNSWGPWVGDGGDFYMSYEFFKTFATEIQEIVDLYLETDIPV